MAEQVGSLFVKIEADVTQLKAELARMKGELQQQKQEFTGLGDVAKTVMGAAIVQAAAKATAEIIRTGVEVQRVRGLFENLGGTGDDMAGLRQATRGMMDDTTAMASASKLMTMGLAENVTEAGKLIEVASQLGSAMGVDAQSAIENFTLMLANQSVLRLDTFGISSGRVKVRIEELQAAFPGMTREAAFTKATLEEAATTMKRVGEQGDSAAAAMMRQQSAVKNLKDAFSELVVVQTSMPEIQKPLEGITGFFQKSAENLKGIKEYKAEWAGLRDEGKLTEVEFRKLSSSVNDLGLLFRLGLIDSEEYEKRLSDLKSTVTELASEHVKVTAPAVGGADEMQAEMAAMRAGNEEKLAIQQEYYARVDEMRAQAADAARYQGQADALGPTMDVKPLADAFSSDEFQGVFASSLESMAGIMADFESNFASITEAGEQRRSDLQFNYNLQRLQAEQAYQAEYTALKAAGRDQDAIELEQSFKTEQEMAAAKYGVDTQMLDRQTLIEKVMKARAYVEELQMQGDKLRQSLAMQLMADQGFLRLEAATQEGILKTIYAGGSESLQMEVKFAQQSREISVALNKGKISDAKATVEAILALQQMNLGAAEAALANLEGQLAAFQVELPPIPMPQLPDLGGGAGSAASKAMEPATKALGDVVSDMARAVTDAKKAMTELLGFELPEGVDEGLKQFGEFTAKAVKSMYDTVMDKDLGLKDKIKKLKDLMAPLRDIMGVFGTDLKAEPMDADAVGNIDVFASQIVEMVTTLRDAIEQIDVALAADDLKETLAELNTNSQAIKGALEVYSVDMSKAVPVKFDFTAKIKGFASQIKEGVIELWGMVKSLPAETKAQMGAAAETLKNAKDMFGILGVFDKLPDMAAVFKFRASSEAYFDAYDIIRGEIMASMEGMTDEDREAEKLAAETSATRKKLFEGVFFDFGSIRAPGRVFKAQLGEILGAVELAVDEAVPVFERIKARWEDSFETVMTTVDFVKGVFGGIKDIADSIAGAVELGGIDVGSALALFDQFRMIFDPINGLIQPTLPGTTPQDGGAPAWAGGGATSSTSTTELIVNFNGESVQTAITNLDESSKYSLAATIAEILYNMGGNAGMARA